MREIGVALLSAGLAWNVLTDRLVVPGAVLGFTQEHHIARRHLIAFSLVLLPSLWISWAVAPYLSFLGREKWIVFLGVAGLVAWGERAISFPGIQEEEVAFHLRLLPANCALLGILLLILEKPQGFLLTTAQGVGATLGYGLVLNLLTTFRIRLGGAPIPKSLVGLPSILILLGLIAMVLMGFAQAFHLHS